ncbi:MAG: S8 family serine peptidase [Anaerolineae bacterium]|nr:S8 family serine peptidase [Anaerolineae bacterium]
MGSGLTFFIVIWLILGVVKPIYGQNANAELVAKAQTEGTIRVVVRLNVPFQPAGNLISGQAVLAQEQAIQQAQTSLLTTVPGYEPASVVNLRYIPYMSLTIDASGLQALLQSPQVAAIAEEGQFTLFLENSTTLIGANAVWSAGYDGTGKTVAIIDSGVDKSHWFLSGRVVAEACFSTATTIEGTPVFSTCPNGQNEQIGVGAGVPCSMPECLHGTHVAGIAAGRGTDFSGVARNASIIGINVGSRVSTILGDSLTIQFSDVAKALEHVYDLRNSFSIASINMSLGTPDVYAGVCDNADASFALVKDAVDTVRSAGIGVIAATGNSGNATGISMPACLSNTISVGATSAEPGTQDRFAAFSNSSSELDLLAPGISINSSAPNNAMASLGGTSMAAPHVAGAWAVLKQAAPSASIDTILNALKNTGIPLTDPRNSIVTPRIQVEAAAAALTGQPVFPPTNDLLAYPVVITSQSFADHLLTRTSNNQTGVPALSGSCSGVSIGKDVWYRYDSTAAESLTLQTQGSAFDTVIAVWTGFPGTPALVGCNDNIAGSTQSRLTFSAANGTSYYIQVGGKGGANGLLRLDMGRGLTHDLITNAKVVGKLPYRDDANTDATGASGDPQPSCIPAWFGPLNSVWYRYTATGNDRIMIDTVGSDYNSLLSVWQGTPGNLTEVACLDDIFFDALSAESTWELNAQVSLQVTSGTTYYIMASGKEAFFTNDPSGELKLNIRRLLEAVPSPLSTPMLLAPVNLFQTLQPQPTLVWNPSPNAFTYELQFGLNNPPSSTPIRTGNTNFTPFSPLVTTTYYWRVRSVGSTNNTSDWSETRQFTVISPENSAPQRNLFTTSTPTLTWSRVNTATAYEIEVAKDAGFVNRVYHNNAVISPEIMVGPLQPGTYYFRVRALNGTTASAWSTFDSFVIAQP